MIEKFVEKTFNGASRHQIEIINGILNDYREQGYRLSLRQLYYQLVARGLIQNSIQSYKRVGDLVSNARLAGLLDWGMIEDRNREVVAPACWDDPADIVRSAVDSFAIDKWENQPNYVEVMVEKQALEGVLIPVCRRNGVRFTANRGYSSSSAMYEAGKRMERQIGWGKDVYVLYLGDHDPSGVDMTRDVRERLELFARYEGMEVQRLALNMNQIEVLNPPKNPAKLTDSRAKAYIRQFGTSSWELDAIEPGQLASLVTDAIVGLRDDEQWQEDLARETAMRAELEAMANNYGKKPKKKAKRKSWTSQRGSKSKTPKAKKRRSRLKGTPAKSNSTRNGTRKRTAGKRSRRQQ